ncbi:MAG: site-2 protease family protein [Chthoniobacteraceae bacterium]
MPWSSRRGGRGLFIGRFCGIDLHLDYSWFFIAALVTYSLAVEVFPSEVPGHSTMFYGLLGGVAASLFFTSILLHELGHSVVSQRCGIPVPRITLLFIGGLAEISREPDDAKSELKIALGGPVVSVILVAFYAGCAWMLARWKVDGFDKVCQWLAITNASLVIFNMIPGYPLDGGRVLRALLWARSGKLRRATYITSRIGIGFSWLLIAFGVWLLITPPHAWNAFVFVLIGMFLKHAAERGYDNAVERSVLVGLTVSDLMTRTPVSIPDHLPLSRAVDEFFLSNHHVVFPVCTVEGEFRGLLKLASLKDVPREQWPYTTAGDVVANGGASALSIEARRPAARAMRELLTPGTGRLAVVEEGKLVGIVTRRDLLQFIEIHNELEA